MSEKNIPKKKESQKHIENDKNDPGEESCPNNHVRSQKKTLGWALSCESEDCRNQNEMKVEAGKDIFPILYLYILCIYIYIYITLKVSIYMYVIYVYMHVYNLSISK